MLRKTITFILIAILSLIILGLPAITVPAVISGKTPFLILILVMMLMFLSVILIDLLVECYTKLEIKEFSTKKKIKVLKKTYKLIHNGKQQYICVAIESICGISMNYIFLYLPELKYYQQLHPSQAYWGLNYENRLRILAEILEKLTNK